MRFIKKLSKKVIAGAVSLSLVAASLAVTPQTAKAAAYADKGAYGIGEGKQIPDHIFGSFCRYCILCVG